MDEKAELRKLMRQNKKVNDLIIQGLKDTKSLCKDVNEIKKLLIKFDKTGKLSPEIMIVIGRIRELNINEWRNKFE